MKILHVIQGIDPRSGGPTRSVKGICRALAKSGMDVTLLVLCGRHKFDNPCGVKVVYGKMAEVREYDLVHLQGLWSLKLHRVALACRRSGVRYVISPRGMLDPWALGVKKWKKRLALFLYQKRDLKQASAFHVTATLEARSVRALGLVQNVIIAPNGVDLPEVMPPKTRVGKKTALFLSRLHPGKGLLILAEAWAKVRPKDWMMKVVGPDSYGHKAEVIAKIRALGIENDWQFVDELNDCEKWKAYRTADLLVHPSVSENFGVTIVEGLAAGLPVIATKGTPWQDLASARCGWWIEQGPEALAAALSEAMSLSDEELRRMGMRGVALVNTKYTWDSIVAMLRQGYDWVLRGMECGT